MAFNQPDVLVHSLLLVVFLTSPLNRKGKVEKLWCFIGFLHQRRPSMATLSQLWSSQTGETDEDVRKRMNCIKNHWAGFKQRLKRREFLELTAEVCNIFEAQRDKRRKTKLDHFNETGQQFYQVDDLIRVELDDSMKLPFETSKPTVYMLIKHVCKNDIHLLCHLCIRPCETIYYENSAARNEVFLVTKQGKYFPFHIRLTSIQDQHYPLPFKKVGEWTLSTEYDLVGGALTDTADARLCYAKAPYKGDVPLLDLFSGCGGFSLGFRDARASAVREAPAVPAHPLKKRRYNPIPDVNSCSASTEARSAPSSSEGPDAAHASDDNGVRIVPAVLLDCNADACLTARTNFKDANVVESRIQTTGREEHIATAAPFSKFGIVIDGSPCQGFSSANSWNRETWDARNDLILVAAKTAVKLEAGYSVKENSPQILNMKRPGDELPILFELVRYYHENEYQVAVHVLWGPYVGVPQTRTRVFLVAAQKGRSLPKFILPTHRIKLDRKKRIPAFVSVDPVLRASVAGFNDWKDAIGFEDMGGLKPPVTVGAALWPWEYRPPNDKQTGHFVTQSTKAKTRNAHADRHELASQNVVKEKDNTIKKEDYAPTILASGWSGAGKGERGSIMWHYSQSRTLTIREAACIQGFPETFQFATKTSAITKDKWFADTWRQVGNAVPPPMANAVAAHILESAEKDANIGKALQHFLDENQGIRDVCC